MSVLEVTCPHCACQVEISDINCGVFRHAVYKTSPPQEVHPHAPQHECERLVRENLVHGCAKPFRVVRDPETNVFVAVVCGWE